MKLLVITQKVDEQDAVLGFFHRWLHEFSKNFDFITVICLGAGEYHLPQNVKVLSLGKESGVGRMRYVLNFYRYIWSERKNYDAVFVHMNQEYILLGWKLWKLLGKKIYLWRNHKMGNVLTRFSVLVSDAVFCTSSGSFTAQFKKTRLMPVGVDSDFFKKDAGADMIPHSIMLLTRISPVKHVDVFIDSLYKLATVRSDFTAFIYGDPTPVDYEYYSKLRTQANELVNSGRLVFMPGIPNTEAPRVYNKHEIFVNLTDVGSFDKTIIEAMLCESVVLASNDSVRDLLPQNLFFTHRDSEDLAEKLNVVLELQPEERAKMGRVLREQAERHSLKKLVQELGGVMRA